MAGASPAMAAERKKQRNADEQQHRQNSRSRRPKPGMGSFTPQRRKASHTIACYAVITLARQ
jgi:hypothetical protein